MHDHFDCKGQNFYFGTGRLPEVKAHVISVRVCTDQDYKPVAEWLKEDQRNHAVLLHSAAYEPGIALFKEFPKQTTFGDLDPVIERADSLPLHTDILPNLDNASYVYEKNSTLFEKEIGSKLNRLLIKSPCFSDPLVVHFLNKFGENLTRLSLRRGTGLPVLSLLK